MKELRCRLRRRIGIPPIPQCAHWGLPPRGKQGLERSLASPSGGGGSGVSCLPLRGPWVCPSAHTGAVGVPLTEGVSPDPRRRRRHHNYSLFIFHFSFFPFPLPFFTFPIYNDDVMAKSQKAFRRAALPRSKTALLFCHIILVMSIGRMIQRIIRCQTCRLAAKSIEFSIDFALR